MKKTILLVSAFAMTFAFGLALNSIITSSSRNQQSIKKDTGIGCIFLM